MDAQIEKGRKWMVAIIVFILLTRMLPLIIGFSDGVFLSYPGVIWLFISRWFWPVVLYGMYKGFKWADRLFFPLGVFSAPYHLYTLDAEGIYSLGWYDNLILALSFALSIGLIVFYTPIQRYLRYIRDGDVIGESPVDLIDQIGQR